MTVEILIVNPKTSINRVKTTEVRALNLMNAGLVKKRGDEYISDCPEKLLYNPVSLAGKGGGR